MAIYAIADLHLSLNTDKPMDIFGVNWENHSEKIKKMVSNVAYFEYIVTDSELEALVLECNLIKKHRPRYNTMLKDDKGYPYIKVTVGEEYPRVLFARNIKILQPS